MSQDPADPFAELLQPGDAIIASMAGPGAPKPNGAQVWIQLALAQAQPGPHGQRLLAIVLVQAPHGGAWQPVSKYQAPCLTAHLFRYPRTPDSRARLDVTGLPEQLIIVDIDDPSIFPHLEPFLSAWAGPIEGAGVVHQRAREHQDSDQTTNPRMLLAITGVLMVLVALCCLCTGVGSLLSRYLPV